MSATMRRSRRGAVLVETAVSLSLFLLLLLGTIELGRAWFSYALLTHAVREGARTAAVTPALRPNDGAVLRRMTTILQDAGLSLSFASVVFQAPLQTGRIVRVTAEVQFSPVIALWLSDGGSALTFPMRVDVVTRYEA